ncbi:MAG: hypothetical protein MK179_20970, partial [Pirellulaceae bacterium]|nr:hypothetical protein [Pirellulaceae bacterium]
VLDIDNGYDADKDPLWSAEIELYRPELAGTLQLVETSGPDKDVGPGTSVYDGWLDAKVELGKYLVKVSNSMESAVADRNSSPGGIPNGVTYDLHFSVKGHPVAEFFFTPQAILEDENGNNGVDSSAENLSSSAQNLSNNAGCDSSSVDGKNWTTQVDDRLQYRNPILPHLSVLGEGDNTRDVYCFSVTKAMLEPEIYKSVESSEVTGPFYTEVVYDLKGKADKWSRWTLELDKVENYLQVTQNTPNWSAASAFADSYEANKNGQPYTFQANGQKLTISLAGGFRTNLKRQLFDPVREYKVVKDDGSDAEHEWDTSVSLDLPDLNDGRAPWKLDVTPSSATSIILSASSDKSPSVAATTLADALIDAGFQATPASKTITIDISEYKSGFDGPGPAPTEVLTFKTTGGNGELIRDGGTGSWDYDNFAIGQQLSITGVRYNPEVAIWVTPTTADNKTLSLGVPHNPPQDLGYIDPTHVELAEAYMGDLTGATLFLNTDEDNFFENQYTVTDVDNQANSKQLTLNGSVAAPTDNKFVGAKWHLVLDSGKQFPEMTDLSGASFDISGLGHSVVLVERLADGKHLKGTASSLDGGPIDHDAWALTLGQEKYEISNVTDRTVTFNLPEDCDVPTADPTPGDGNVTSTGTPGGSYKYTPNHVDIGTDNDGSVTLTRGDDEGDWLSEGFLKNQYITINDKGTEHSEQVDSVTEDVLTLKGSSALSSPQRIVFTSADHDDLLIQQRPFTIQATFPAAPSNDNQDQLSTTGDDVFRNGLPTDTKQHASPIEYTSPTPSTASPSACEDEDWADDCSIHKDSNGIVQHYESVNVTLQDENGGMDFGQRWTLSFNDKDYTIVVPVAANANKLAKAFGENINWDSTVETISGLGVNVRAEVPVGKDSILLKLTTPSDASSTEGPGNTIWGVNVQLDSFSVKSAFTLESEWRGLSLTGLTGLTEIKNDLGPFSRSFTKDYETVGQYYLEVKDPSYGFVPRGARYDLLVELQRHETGSAIDLAEKKVRVIEGTGKGQVGEIESYNSETGKVKLTEWEPRSDGKVAETLDDTSLLAFEDPDYVATDHYKNSTEYHVFLTKKPTADVTLSVEPKESRTYDSERAFDSDKGTRTAYQVEVCTAAEPSVCGTEKQTLRFDSINWHEPQPVTIEAHADEVVDGSDALVFPGLDERTQQIRGPLDIDGGLPLDESFPLENPLLYPGENNLPEIDGVVRVVVDDSSESTVTFGNTNRQAPAYFRDDDAKHHRPGCRDQNREECKNDGFDPRIENYPYSFTFFPREFSLDQELSVKTSNSQESSYKVSKGDDLGKLANSLASQLNQLAGYSAEAVGEVVTITSDDPNETIALSVTAGADGNIVVENSTS